MLVASYDLARIHSPIFFKTVNLKLKGEKFAF